MLQGQEMKRRMSPLGASFGSGHSSDSAAMASGSPDVATNQEPAEVQEDCSGKKKSKFQTFKKLFARKKRKEPQNAGVEEGLKGSQSSDNVSKTSENNTLTRSEKEKGSGSRISLGNKALSHDSVFVSDSSEANEGLGASQDSIHGKVKSLQLQLKQAIRLGSPPSLMCVKKTEDAGATSEDDGLPCSPPDYTPLHSVKSKAERSSSNSLHGVDGDEQLSGRALSPPAVPGDFSQPASPFVCLDNSAAKHKLGLRNKACNRRKPARRLELKAEGESTAEEEELTVSLTAADVTEEQQKAEVESRDQLKAETEEEEDEEDKPQKDSAAFPLGGSDGEDDAEAEQDVSHAPDASCPPESGFSEEEEEEEEEDEEEQDASVDRRAPSSSSGSTSSSLDSPSVSPEPPAGQTEHLTSPAGFCCAVHSESDSLTGEEENVDEGSSLLEEVLSSLKTSHSPDVEVSGVVMETEETEDEAVEVDERKEEEDPTGCEGPALSPDTSDRTAQEEEEVLPQSLQEEEVTVEEEEEEEEEEAKSIEEEPEENKVSEQFIQHIQHTAEEEEEEEEEKQSAPEPGDSSGQESPSTPTDQSKVRFTVAPAWQRLQSHPTSPSAAPALWDSRAEVETADRKERNVKAEPGSPAEGEAAPSPLRGRSSGSFTSKPQSYAASAPAEAQTALPGRTPESAAVAEANPDSPFGVRLRKTSALLRLGSEEVESEPQVESPTHPPSAKVESPQPISSKPPASHPIGNKPALPRKPEVHGDAGVKPRRISEPPPARSAPGGSDSPSWISVAKQKQKVYKETPLNEITVKKEEQEKKPALPPSREQSSSSSKPLEPTSRVSVEKETRRTFSVPTPVPPQPPKPLLQKPQAPPTPAKPSPRPDSPRSSPAKPPPVLSKTPPVASPRTVPEKPASPQRGSPPATLPQNEPPWMALAKKKAKAWSEMPQIVQ
ncbi:PREDICTED: uncharacterized protein KIAA1211-like isoform X7 [Poecilia mexicana]|uniref:uncharacterized protein KIAA1211-like isoform X7 n=1 Tax=Poecilia mexicana TaxID=48701 RepID=UPI00072E8233|nr:PREDICTED: uncharacterized protein KIAA1211-like isoform X7 [Poecilia mexicana]